MADIKFSANVTHSNGRISDCRSFTGEADMDTWATEQLRNDPGAVVMVWKAYSSEVYRIYQA